MSAHHCLLEHLYKTTNLLFYNRSQFCLITVVFKRAENKKTIQVFDKNQVSASINSKIARYEMRIGESLITVLYKS